MSDYTVFNDITGTLISVLRTNMNGLIATDHISARSPADAGMDDQPQLSLFLYQVGEDRHLKNQDVDVIDATTSRYPPLCLQLFYLLSAQAKAPDTEQQLMGRAMQILYDCSVLKGSVLQGSLAGTAEELSVTINSLSIDDLNKLWSLFSNKPYKMSVGYQVSPALLDSTRQQSTARITEQTTQYSVG